MEKTHSILVYVDIDAVDDVGLKMAVELATQIGANLEIVAVAPAPSQFPATSKSDIDDLLAEKRLSLRCAVERIGQIAAPVSTNLLRGQPAIALARHVQQQGHDLVLKMARRDEAGGLFYGPLAAQLMRICPRPVWILQPHRPIRPSRILAAVDAEIEDRDRFALNIRVLELASSLARLHDAELTVPHAWDVLAAELLQKRMAEPESEAMLGKHQRAADQRLSELLAKVSNVPPAAHICLPRGDAKRIIPAFATELNVDLVVMGTVSRTGLAGLLIGNTAEAVLPQLNCSLLTVKPPGFESPVVPRESRRGAPLHSETVR